MNVRRSVLPLVISIGLAIAVGTLFAPATARADGATDRKVQALDRDGLHALRDGKADEATRAFTSALRLCERKGQGDGKLAGQTMLYLALARHAANAPADEVQGLIKQALAKNPHPALPGSLVTPAFQALYDLESGVPVAAIAVEVPAELRAGEPATVRARPAPTVAATELVLVYRPAGAATFLQRKMERAGDGFETTLPAEVTARGSCAYYLEARDGAGRVLAATGDAEHPEQLALGGTSLVPAATATGSPPPGEAGPAVPRGPSRWTFGVAAGFGGGWVRGRPEVFPEAVIKPGLSASTGFLSLQGTRMVGDGPWVVGAVLRLQLLTDTGPVADPMAPARAGMPDGGVHSAVAGFAMGGRWFGSGRARVLAAALVGGGQVRYPVDLRPYAGYRDTLEAGPVLVGPGARAMWALTEDWSVRLDVDALTGLWPTADWRARSSGGYRTRTMWINAVNLDAALGVGRSF